MLSVVVWNRARISTDAVRMRDKRRCLQLKQLPCNIGIFRIEPISSSTMEYMGGGKSIQSSRINKKNNIESLFDMINCKLFAVLYSTTFEALFTLLVDAKARLLESKVMVTHVVNQEYNGIRD